MKVLKLFLYFCFLLVFLHDLQQCFSTKGTLSPKGHLAMSGDIFGCYNWNGGWRWHLAGKGQGCYWTCHNAQDTPSPSKELSDLSCQQSQPRLRKLDLELQIGQAYNELLRSLSSMTEFIWGKYQILATKKGHSWHLTSLRDQPIPSSVPIATLWTIYACLVNFLISENEIVTSHLSNFPVSEKNWQTFQEISLYWHNWKATNKFTFKLIFKGILWVFWMSFQVLLEWCWKAVNLVAVN